MKWITGTLFFFYAISGVFFLFTENVSAKEAHSETSAIYMTTDHNGSNDL